MAFLEAQGIGYAFGLAGNEALRGLVDDAADDIRTRRALKDKDVLRGHTETRHAARSWNGRKRRVCARIEASRKGLDVRFVVTSIPDGDAKTIYADIYCARGQAENLIKLHKSQLASDRSTYTLTPPLTARQPEAPHPAHRRLLADAHPARRHPEDQPLAKAEFATLRLRLLKLGARVHETTSRIKIAFAAACPQAALVRQLAHVLMPAAP